MFVAEFSNINDTGVATQGLILAAEVVSCGKRTLARYYTFGPILEKGDDLCKLMFSSLFRMLVIIVSLGFGIVKPRLGSTMHRVVAIGSLYFCIASAEAYLRIMKPKNDISSTTMLAGIPLAVIDRY